VYSNEFREYFLMETEREEDRELKKTGKDPGAKHVAWLNPNDPEGAYAAMMVLLDDKKKRDRKEATQDTQQQEDARTP